MEWNKINVKMLSMFGQGGAMFGMTLPALMNERQDVMVLSADMSTPAGLDKFKTEWPEHFMNVGIAEQNMMGIAAGLSDNGYRTIVEAQACFVSMRAFEPVRQYCGYMHGNTIMVGIGSGFSLTLFGNTHYALEDMALMRLIPRMTVVAPCDAFEAAKALEAAMQYDGPVYIRLYGGTGTPVVYKEDFDFCIGQAMHLRKGTDMQLIATGSMVSVAMKVAEILCSNGIEVGVVDMHTVKPLDEAAIDYSTGTIVTLEEHYTTGGLGDAVAQCLCEKEKHPKLIKLGVEDRYSEVGDYAYLIEQHGLTPKIIAEKLKNLI